MNADTSVYILNNSAAVHCETAVFLNNYKRGTLSAAVNGAVESNAAAVAYMSSGSLRTPPHQVCGSYIAYSAVNSGGAAVNIYAAAGEIGDAAADIGAAALNPDGTGGAVAAALLGRLTAA